jgi:hypothetical protein
MVNKRHNIFLGLLPLLLVIELLASIVCFPRAIRGNADFHQFYNGAYMLRAGYRHQLYDYDLQVKVGGSQLPSVHPAYEYLLFVPLSFLRYRTAYFAWLLVNCGLIIAAIRLLRSYFTGSGWLLAGIVIAFIPVWVTLYEGQDSLLLLVLLLLAARSDEFGSGLWLGLGAFKFHIVVPIMLLYLLWRKWRVVAGFGVSGGLVAVISIALVGIGGTLHYVHAASGMALTYLHPGAMPNVHGLLLRIAGAKFGSNHIITLLTVAIAAVTFAWASRQKPSLATAILVLPLTTVYLLGHDLALLLIPIVASELWLTWAGSVLILASGPYAGFAVLPLLADLLVNTLVPDATRRPRRHSPSSFVAAQKSR